MSNAVSMINISPLHKFEGNDGAMAANYTYNGNGHRVKKNVNGTITYFHYSRRGQLGLSEALPGAAE